MKKANIVAAIAAACGTAGAAPASATNEVAELPPVAVYASRVGDTAAEMDSSVAVFTAADIEASGAKDLPDLLRKKAGIDVRALSGNPMQSAVYMRGFGENGFGRVKILLDGEELNCVDMAAPNLMRVPLGNVERVEVVHGPSPVLYGDGAVAGVVSATTVTQDYDERTRVTAKAGSQDTFGANLSTRGGLEEEGVEYAAAYDYLSSDGYRDHSAYDAHTANASVRKNFDNGSTFAVKANYQNGLYDLPGSLTEYQWKHGRKTASSPDDWCRVWNYGIGLDARLKLADDQWLYVDGGFADQYRHAKYVSSYGTYDYEYDCYSYWFSPRYVNTMDVFGLGNKFTAGLDFRYDRYGKVARSGATPYSAATRAKSRFDRSRWALFARDELFLTEELSVIAGARVERIGNHWADDPGVAEPHSHDWMGDFELGLVYRPFDGLKTYAKATRFHRSAFCDEMNYTQDGRMLKPETGVSLDAGVEWDFLEEFSFGFNAYSMVMEDEIFYNPYATPSEWGGWNGYNANSPSKTRRLGFDTGLSWLRDKVAEASVKYSAVRAEFAGGRYHGESVPLVPSHRVRAEAGVWIFDDLEVKGGYSYVSAQRLAGDFDGDHGRLGAYSLFDVGVYYSPSWAKGWKASLVVDNLFDRNCCDFAGWSYYSGAYYYPACGRSFLFTLSYEF